MAGTSLVVSSITCFCIVFITGIVLFSCSFSILELHEWGIIFDNNNQKVENTTYPSGRYFTGLGRKFIKFDRRLISIGMSKDDESQTSSLEGWTIDGMNVIMDMSLYIKLNKDKLRELYFMYGDTWYATCVRICQAAIKDRTTDFNTSQFFMERESISQAIINEITSRFKTLTNGAIELVDFQFREVNFEAQFEDIITKKLIQQQKAITAKIVRSINLIEKETEFIYQLANNNITLIKANASAQGIQKIAIAKGEAYYALISNMTNSYIDLINNITGSASWTDDQKLKFIYANELAQTNANSTFINIDRPWIQN